MLLFSFDYPPNDGGIARLCDEITRGLQSRQYSLHVLSQQSNITEQLEIDKIANTHRVTSKRPLREFLAWFRLTTQKNEDICISGIWYPEGILARLSDYRYRVILAHSAELYPPRQRWRQPLWRYLQRFTLESADVVIANSHFTAEFVTRVAPKAHVIVVPLAVDHQRFRPLNHEQVRTQWQINNDQFVVCTVSRVHRFKGHETVLETIASLPSEIRDHFVYLIGGKGSAVEYLQTRAQQLGVSEQVRWLGFVADEDLPSLYSASDLFVLVTREIPDERSVEGFGLAFLEAQACGTPVVGTNTGGIPDAVSHGDGGWLIEQDDVQALSVILVDLYNNPEVFRAMGQKARRRVESEFTWDHYFERFLSALAQGGIQFDR